MLVSVLRSKLHRATVTASRLDYEGSLGLSRELMEAVGFHPYEQVEVANINNGERFTTYIIPLEEPGQVVLNGAAARLGSVGDRLIIMSFVQLAAEEIGSHRPRIAVLDEANRIVETK